MNDQLRTAMQAALEALEKADKISGYLNNKMPIGALEAALAEPQPIKWNELDALKDEYWNEPQPVHECADNDSPWLVCKPCAAEGKCKQAEPQPEPGAQSRTIREIICYIRGNDLGSIGDEWIAALQVPQAQQPRFVKPWQERLPCSPMNCSASEVVAAQQAEIDEWRNGQAQQPLADEQIGGKP